ncbi:MAG TPA: methionine synthase [Candidatus Binataceae bacterium]|nr:methionine synthase [Candidatus Binataceae bacterium]
MSKIHSKSDLLRQCLTDRILVIDGALGTSIQSWGLGPEHFGGAAREGCNEILVLTQPETIGGLHRAFLEAGADLIETDSFGSNAIVLAEFGLQHQARELNRAAAALARQAADAFSTPQWPRFVAGAMGPTTKTISVTGGIGLDELAAAYQEQAEGLIEGGVDVLLLETVQDTLNVKAGLLGIERAMARMGVEVGIAVQGTIETTGTLLAGQDIEAFYVALAHRDLLWIGLNCATGADFMTDHLRTLASISRFPVACVPNAGLPDEDGCYHETPQLLASKLERFMAAGWLNLAGGCCGTTPDHIRLVAQAARRACPREPIRTRRSAVSGLEALVIDEQTRPVIVGERTNVLGSRRFKRLIARMQWDAAAEVGRAQARGGAHVLDVCLQDPDRNESSDLGQFLEVLVKKIKVPVMLDSTDPGAIEQGLKRLQGKAIINSINLEDGARGPRLLKIVELARRWGAALVVGCIDEDPQQAQAITSARKLAIARRAFALLTGEHGIAPEDIIFDPLVFPVGTGDRNYVGSAIETIEGIRALKAALPQCKTILGISNVSFGLPEAGREVLNSVMLYHCVQAGLDMAILNAEKLVRYSSISAQERGLAEDLLWWRGDDPIGAFAAHFRAVRSCQPEASAALPLEERLARYILEGSREGLFGDLAQALKTSSPLEIINGPLMRGMDEVGRLFNANQMIVAEVLQSAEAMKAAVSYLEPHMEKSQSAGRGSIVLATVKGDVHDIGKNLVEIILSNNGYRVINLGIKVAPETLIEACRIYQPDMIGLSGLLVKSAQMMVATAQDLRAAGIDCPMLVGGAALSARFTRTRIAPEYEGLVVYANDAMNGLDLAHQLMDPARRAQLAQRLRRESEQMLAQARPMLSGAVTPAREPSPVTHQPAPVPPDLVRHVLTDYDLREIFEYINPVMLYTRHLGLRDAPRALAAGDPKARRLRERVEEVQDLMVAHEQIRAAAVFQFFPAHSEGCRLLLHHRDGGRVLGEFSFGRQSQPPGLCLADFVGPRDDYVALFVTTVGPGVRALAERWKAEGEYLRSHILQVLALESAEAFAEILHRKLRQWWGFADPPEFSKTDLFQARYRGKRYSFGYPACPRLEDQALLFALLEPEATIGVRLTEGFMMEPEGSVSAMVLHHPQARYFALAPADVEQLIEREQAMAGAAG